MNYHIDTGLIYDKFKENCECPLCAIEKIVEEEYLHEFLNDAVMEDSSRIKVGQKGFCEKHFNMLFKRRNKLSVALQMRTRLDVLSKDLVEIKSASQAKKLSAKLENEKTTCVICDYVEESMIKYYKTVAQLFAREKEFYALLSSGKGVCLNHYAKLLKYANSAGFMKKTYLLALSKVENENLDRINGELKIFCDKHDYRNANVPLGDAETALPRAGEKFYGIKSE